MQQQRQNFKILQIFKNYNYCILDQCVQVTPTQLSTLYAVYENGHTDIIGSNKN